MKKVFLVLALLAVGGMLFSSCSSAHSCPAYSKVHELPEGQPS
ncbi:MAG TPA: hypothetical protein PLA11_00225 [Flavobacteriales bacterium]|nr:hypothetical protein [Flavobacteriales bacterium]HPF66167.1 hypothetical protein [Flavobacteriales bacterium]HPJ51713.1 hypothetical protein [Flavobacteriales bacterium]